MSLVAVLEVDLDSKMTATTYEDDHVTKLQIDFSSLLRINVTYHNPIKLARLAQSINEIFND